MNRLKQLRKVRFTQDEIADALNVGRSTYTKYENGAIQMSADVLVRFSEIYYLRFSVFARFCVNNGTTIYYYICAWRFAVLPGV